MLLHTSFEVLGLTLAWQGTLTLRLILDPYFGTALTRASLWHLAPPLSGIILLWIIAKAWVSAVRPKKQPQIGDGFTVLIEASLIVGTLTILMTFFSRQLGAELSRSFVLLFAPISVIVLFLMRYAALLIIISIEKHWPTSERVAILGTGEEALLLLGRLRTTESRHVQVAGIILPEEQNSFETAVMPAPILGTTRSLAVLINSASINRIIIAKNGLSEMEACRCGVVTQRMGVVLSQAVTAPAAQLRVGFSHIEGLSLLEFCPIAFSRPFDLIKRCFDIVVSGLLLLLFAPLMVATALGIILTSKGPVFYRDTRVGKGGRHFKFLKFRSMYHAPAPADAENRQTKDGHIFKDKKDRRITQLGRIIRKYSIDELPQLFHVLRGDMSLVGPRPLPARDLDPDGQSRQFAHWSEQRSKVLPGITGLWQIRGRSDLSFQDLVQLDLEYIQNWSLDLDFRILLETPLVVLTGRGAY